MKAWEKRESNLAEEKVFGEFFLFPKLAPLAFFSSDE
jgi:hypothetical protein